MTIQWSLVLFSALAGIGSWAIAACAFTGIGGDDAGDKAKRTTVLVSLVLIVIGGIASFTHLAHPERVMSVLAHPTVGIFAEAAFSGVMVLLLVVLLTMIVRKVSVGSLKVILLITGVVGVVFSFMIGYSYIMPSREAWNTLSLPLAYMGTAAAAGTALYASITSAYHKSTKIVSNVAIVGGALSLVTSLVYGLQIGSAFGPHATLFWVGVILCGSVIPLAGCILARKKSSPLVYYAVCTVLACIGCIALRVLMWSTGSGINLFGVPM